jgi:enoyl-CoA hydratase
MSTFTRLHLGIEEALAVITVQREDKLNAFDAEMIAELHALCRNIDEQNAIRVVIITGAGSRAFCAGGDIHAWSDHDAHSFGQSWVRYGHEAFDALARLRQPVIAVLNGDALGGGLELAACADLRIAEAHARLGQPESGLGIIAGWSGTQRAARRFGAQTVRRMAIFGEVFNAAEALQIGLIDHMVETGQGLSKAREIAARLLTRASFATELSKMLVNLAEGEERERVAEALAGIAAAGSLELREGLAAFREKRRPRFNT